MTIPRPGPFPGGAPRPGPPVQGAGPYQPGPRPEAAQAAQPAQPVQGAAGVPGVEAAVARLGELDELPVGAHVARYDALHGELSAALAAIDGV